MKKRWIIALTLLLVAFTVSGCIKFVGLEPTKETENLSEGPEGTKEETEDPSEETGETDDGSETEPETEDEGPVANGEQIAHIREVFTNETLYLDAVGYKLGEPGFCEKLENQGWRLYGSDTVGEIEAENIGTVVYERTEDDDFVFYVENPTSSARSASECVLYAITVETYDPENVVNAYLPGYIGIGSTIEEVRDYFGTPGEAEYDEDGETVWYYDYYSYDYSSLDDPDGYYGMSFGFEDDVVVALEIFRYFDEDLDEDDPGSGEDAYDLEEFGLRIRMPEDYSVSSEEEIESLNNANWTYAFMAVAGIKSLEVEFMNDSAYSTIKNLNYTEESLAKLLATTVEQTFSLTGQSMEGTWGEPETVEIAGQDFTGVSWNGTFSGAESGMFIYCQDTGETFLAIISFRLGESGQEDGSLDYFEPID